MRITLFAGVALLTLPALAQAAERHPAKPPAQPVITSSHVCGDTRLSAKDQSDCRAQLEQAKTDPQRIQVINTFAARASVTMEEGGSTVEAAKRAPLKTSTVPAPATAAPGAATEPYPAEEHHPQELPGREAIPQTARPPT